MYWLLLKLKKAAARSKRWKSGMKYGSVSYRYYLIIKYKDTKME
jgi:hypothetical protein